MPFDGIHFKTPDLLGFPGNHLPSIRKRNEMFGAERFGAVTAPFHQNRLLAPSILGEDDPIRREKYILGTGNYREEMIRLLDTHRLIRDAKASI